MRTDNHFEEKQNFDLAALFGVPLLGFIFGGFLCLGEEVDLLADDLASVTVGAVLVGPFGIMNTTRDHDHCALDDMLCNAFADAVGAGDPVPLVLCTSSTPVSDWQLPSPSLKLREVASDMLVMDPLTRCCELPACYQRSRRGCPMLLLTDN
jgi:hypothetical protein